MNYLPHKALERKEICWFNMYSSWDRSSTCKSCDLEFEGYTFGSSCSMGWIPWPEKQ